MKQLPRFLRPAWAALLLATGTASLAQKPAVRLAGPISDAVHTTLVGSRSPRALPANDVGVLPANTAINGISLVFNRSAAQEADLTALLAAQTTSSSAQFHKWLTPEQFGARFGVADADLAQAEAWLASGGFTGLSISPARNQIDFSGTAAQVNAAFGTELHQYRSGTEARTNYAPSTDLVLPKALSPLVLSVDHLSTFRPKPQIRTASTHPQFTSSVSGSHFLAPGDVATQYDMNSVYNSGFNGAGESIAVVGQSDVRLSDIQHFQSAAGLPNNPPTPFLMPGTGVSAIYDPDQGESDLDLEWTSAMARGAQIIFVYTGDSFNYGVFSAITYSVMHNLAPIITVSYGSCELAFSSSTLAQYSALAQQASAQGQTIITSTGDAGSTSCFLDTNLTLAQQETPSVGVLADLANVTGIGGVQMQAGTFSTGNTTYFAAATGSDNLSSLISYVPETVWNEDSAPSATSAGGLSSGGGGASTLIPRPSWQTGVPGIPAGSFRLVPDISIQASTVSPGFLFCSSDITTWGPQQVGSCVTGFRDSSGQQLLTVAGGTSFGSPIFAGMLAVLNQAKHIPAQGNINPILYGLAGNPTTYASAFHDITTGTNACTVASASICSAAGAAGFAAGVGYDQASGLGTIDLAKLIAAWPASTGTALAASKVTLSAATLTPASGATDLITIAVAASTGSGVPTGSLSVSVDGSTPIAVPLTNGTATFTYPGTAIGGSHLVSVTYSGDTAYASSVASITLSLAGTVLPTGSFSLAAVPVTVLSGSKVTSTVTLTPVSGYTGSVDFNITSGLPANTCYVVNPIVTSTTGLPIPTYSLIIGAGATICAQGLFQTGSHGANLTKPAGGTVANTQPSNPHHPERMGTLLAGLMGLGLFARRRSRRLPDLLLMGLFTLIVGLGLGGCGSNSAVTAPIAPTSTAYTLTLVGTDSVISTITASTTLTLTIN